MRFRWLSGRIMVGILVLWCRFLWAAPLIQVGHSDGLEGLAYGPNGDLATAGSTTTRIWNAKGELQRVLRGGVAQNVGGVAWSGDGRFLAVSGYDGVRIWNAKTGQLRVFLKQGGGGISFSLDSRRFLCAWGNSEGAIFDTANWRRVETIPASYGRDSLRGALSPDGRYAVMVDSGNYYSRNQTSIEVLDVATAKAVATLAVKRGVKSLSFAPDGVHIALGQADNTLTLWNWRRKTSQFLLDGNTPNGAIWPIYHVQFSNDGQRLYSTADDGSTKVFAVPSGNLLRAIPDFNSNYLLSVSPDEKRFARRGGRSVTIGDAEGKLVLGLPDPPPTPDNVVFSAQGDLLAWSTANEVQVWRVHPFKKLWSQAILGDVAGLYFEGKKRLQVALFFREEEEQRGEMWSFDLAEGRLVGSQALAAAPLQLSPDGGWVANHWLYQSAITISQTKPGFKAKGLRVVGQGMSFAFGPPGQGVSASRSDLIQVWDLKSGKPRIIHPPINNGNDLEAGVLAYSTRGKLVAGGGYRGLRIWDTAKRRERQLPVQTQTTQLQFSPDEKLLATGDSNGGVRLWLLSDSPQQKTASVLLGSHSDSVRSVAFSPDGKTLVSTARDGTLKTWDVTSRLLNLTVSFANEINQKGYVIEARGRSAENFVVAVP